MTDETRIAIILEIQDISSRLEGEMECLAYDCHHSTVELLEETLELLCHISYAFRTKQMIQHDKDWDIYKRLGYL